MEGVRLEGNSMNNYECGQAEDLNFLFVPIPFTLRIPFFSISIVLQLPLRPSCSQKSKFSASFYFVTLFYDTYDSSIKLLSQSKSRERIRCEALSHSRISQQVFPSTSLCIFTLQVLYLHSSTPKTIVLFSNPPKQSDRSQQSTQTLSFLFFTFQIKHLLFLL